MTAGTPDRIRRTARLAGGLYLALIPFSVFATLYVPSALVVPGDAAATAQRIMSSEWLVRTGTVSHLVAELLLLSVALALFEVFKHVNGVQAALMVILVALGAAIGMFSELNRLAALQVLSGADYLHPLAPAQLHAQAMLSWKAWESGMLLTQVFWGLWLLPLGWLVLKSRLVPRLLGILLIVAGVGYAFDPVLAILSPTTGVAVSPFTFVGELVFVLWLVFKGVKVGQRDEVTPAEQTTEA